MKKLWILAGLLVIVLAFAACSGDDDTNGNDDLGSNVEDTGGEPDDNEVTPEPEPDPINLGNEEEPNGEDPYYENGEDPYEENGYENGDDPNGEDDEPNGEEGVVIPPRPAGVLWSLRTDVEFQNLAEGTRGNSEAVLGTEFLVGAGGLTFQAVAGGHGGGHALQMTHRTENWHGLDINTGQLNLNRAANSYQITVRGNLATAGNIVVGGAESPWDTFHTHAASGNFNFNFVLTEAHNMGNGNRLRIAASNMSDLRITEIEVRRVARVVEEAPPVAVEIPARPAGVVWSLRTDEEFQTLDVGTRGNSDTVLGTPYLVGAGGLTFQAVAGGHGGGHALQMTHRDDTWNGVDIQMATVGINRAVNSYQITVRGNIASAGNIIVGGAEQPWATFHSHAATGDFNFNFVLTEAHDFGNGDRMRIAASNHADLRITEIEIRRVDRVVPQGPPVVPPLAAGMVYTLRSDAGFQGIPIGTSGGTEVALGDTPALQGSGEALFAIVASPLGGNGIRVFNRTLDWHTIDLMLAGMNMNPSANSYTITITGRVVSPPAEGGTVDIMGTGGAWGRFNRPGEENHGQPLTGASFTTTAVIDAAGMAANAGPGASDQARVRFAIGGAAEANIYYIYSIEVRRN